MGSIELNGVNKYPLQAPQPDGNVNIGGNVNNSSVTGEGPAATQTGPNSILTVGGDGSANTTVTGDNNNVATTVINGDANINVPQTREEKMEQAMKDLVKSPGWKALNKQEQKLLLTHLNYNPFAINELVNNARFNKVSYDKETGILKFSQDEHKKTDSRLKNEQTNFSNSCVLELDTNAYKKAPETLDDLKMDIHSIEDISEKYSPNAVGRIYINMQNLSGKVYVMDDSTWAERYENIVEVGPGCNIEFLNKEERHDGTLVEKPNVRYTVKLAAKNDEGLYAKSTVTVPNARLHKVFVESYGDGRGGSISERPYLHAISSNSSGGWALDVPVTVTLQVRHERDVVKNDADGNPVTHTLNKTSQFWVNGADPQGKKVSYDGLTSGIVYGAGREGIKGFNDMKQFITNISSD